MFRGFSIAVAVGISAFAFGATSHLAAQASRVDGASFSSAGEMLRPEHYREWIYLSSGIGTVYGPLAAERAGRPPTFTNVFVNPAAHRRFLETGVWPDGTVLVLEIRESVHEPSISAEGRFQGGIIAVEAALKDSARFDERWGYFNFGMAGDRAAALPTTASCYSCHKTNGAVEQTFVQFYPTLMDAARRHGTVRPDYGFKLPGDTGSPH
jgi:hypothetical protein